MAGIDTGTLERMVDAAAAVYGYDPDRVLGQTKHPVAVDVRRAVAYALHRKGHSYAQIGAVLGGRHYSTILHAVETAGFALATDHSLRLAVEAASRILDPSAAVPAGDLHGFMAQLRRLRDMANELKEQAFEHVRRADELDQQASALEEYLERTANRPTGKVATRMPAGFGIVRGTSS